MNIKVEKSFVNRSKDITLLFPLLFTWPLIAQRSYRWTDVNKQRWQRTRRETTRREAEQAGDREFSGTKASLRGGLDLTSILGRVHSRRRRREESVPSPGARMATTRLNVPPDQRLSLQCCVFTRSDLLYICNTCMKGTAKLSDFCLLAVSEARGRRRVCNI